MLDAVVIGGGVAGLCAARTLLRAGRTVQVLEARGRVGGRTAGEHLLGIPVDVGGQWAGPRQHRLLALLAELGLETYPQHTDGERLLELDGHMRRYRGTIPKLPLFALLELGWLQARINRLSAQIDPVAPWRHPQAAALDAQTAASWIHGRLRSRSARGVMDVVARAIFSAEAQEFSALSMLSYFRHGSSFDEMAETVDGAQSLKVKGGMFQLAQRLAAALPPGVVQLEAAVSAVEQDERGVRVHHRKGVTEARRVVLAAAPTLLGRIAYSPTLPALREQLHQRLPMGNTIKVLVAYPSAFWRAQGLSGEIASAQGPFSPVMDAGVPGRSEGLLVGFLAGAQAREVQQMDAAQRRQTVVDCLVRYLGPAAAQPLAYVEKDWSSDPWSLGAYASLFPPGTLTAYGPWLREPCGRLHWAGTETAQIATGYIEGAIESGERAAAELAALL